MLAGGKLLVAREPRQFAIARYSPSGRLDPTFGTHGVATTDFGSFRSSRTRLAAGVAAVALQPDGKIVAFGWSRAREPDPAECIGGSVVAVARYLPDGRLDPTFGHNGKVVTDFPTSGPAIGDGAVAGALEPSGRVVAVARSSCQTTSTLELAGYSSNGLLDRRFGRGGRVVNLDLSPSPGALMQRDGKIVLAGSVQADPAKPPRLTLARYLPTGRPDQAFGKHGMSVSADGGWNALAQHADDTIVVAGRVRERLTVAEYRPNGEIDRDFGDEGFARVALPDNDGAGSAVALQDDGKIVVGGFETAGTEEPARSTFVLARLDPDGRLDQRFGRGGVSVDRRLGPVLGLAIQADGRIVVLALRSPREADGELVLLRYTPAGELDKRFGDVAEVGRAQ